MTLRRQGGDAECDPTEGKEDEKDDEEEEQVEQEDAVHWEGHCLIQLILLDLRHYVIQLNVHVSCFGLEPKSKRAEH